MCDPKWLEEDRDHPDDGACHAYLADCVYRQALRRAHAHIDELRNLARDLEYLALRGATSDEMPNVSAILNRDEPPEVK